MKQKSDRSLKRYFLLIFMLSLTVSLFAHYTWITPAPAIVEVGKSVKIRFMEGHAFPDGGGPVRDMKAKLTLLQPSGKSVKLTPADQGNGLEASFQATSRGVYRLAGELDYGVSSRTPSGLKMGGRSKNPKAISATKYYGSFLCAVRTSPSPLSSSGPLMGLPFEISWTRQGNRLIIRAAADNKPAPGVEISAAFGTGEPQTKGNTDTAGNLTLDVPGNFQGLILLNGLWVKSMPPGADYDTERSNSSYYLNWE